MIGEAQRRREHVYLGVSVVAEDLRLAASEGAWRCSGLKDAVERSVGPAGAIPSFVPSGCVPSGYVPSGYVPPPRSARGAPRA